MTIVRLKTTERLTVRVRDKQSIGIRATRSIVPGPKGDTGDANPNAVGSVVGDPNVARPAFGQVFWTSEQEPPNPNPGDIWIIKNV